MCVCVRLCVSIWCVCLYVCICVSVYRCVCLCMHEGQESDPKELELQVFAGHLTCYTGARIQTLFLPVDQQMLSQDWRERQLVKITYCFCRDPECSSRHLHQVSHIRLHGHCVCLPWGRRVQWWDCH